MATPPRRSSNALSYVLLFLFLALDTTSALAARKDFKGLFGSYRKEKFTENEGRQTSFGFDMVLSALFPLGTVVSSRETTTITDPFANLHYATTFNFEVNFFLNLMYHWQLSARIGYYNYETRKENTVFTDPQFPLFHQFEMQIVPAIFGLKYRFTRTDIVPYAGIGVGLAYVQRRGFYDYNATLQTIQYDTSLAGEITFGVEFYFASQAGLRLEASAFYLKVPEFTFDLQTQFNPALRFAGNIWSVRYASGIFILF